MNNVVNCFRQKLISDVFMFTFRNVHTGSAFCSSTTDNYNYYSDISAAVSVFVATETRRSSCLDTNLRL